MKFLENETVITIYHTLAYLLVTFILFYLGKLIYQWFHKKIDVKKELVVHDNLAFSIAHVGYFIGLILAIGGAIVGPSHGLLFDLFDIGLYGILSILLLNFSTIINDKIILRKFSVYKEIIEDRNVGTGVVEAASAIASGLIIFGAVSGENQSTYLYYEGLINPEAIITAIGFWGIGQLVMILVARVYNMITSYDIHEYIEKDNVAVGIGFAGALVALGNLVRFALAGDFISWTESLSNVGIEVAIGLALLPFARLLADKILLPGQKLTDEIINQEHPNIGAAIIEAFAYIGGSVLITWCL
ncbi:MAG: DUF350 domain-containing protein [Bacteroidales bacterium]|nr:DUF350 domain-containing protein [Bacteroidales bacterium]